MRRIKRTKITVIRTETIFLRMQDGSEAEIERELLEIQSADLKTDERSVLEIEAKSKETESQGEVK